MAFPDWNSVPAPVISFAVIMWVLWKVGLLKKGNGNGNGQSIRRAGSEATDYWTNFQARNKQEILDAVEDAKEAIINEIRDKK